uniref:Uncharacterized protein n=1 Tax=Onchocerca volvulus TaxID=6282 RepID=A0A2K6VDW9_ONCVO
MDSKAYLKLMAIWNIDRIDSRRGFEWKVMFPQFFAKFHIDKDSSSEINDDEMADTKVLAERTANFVLEDDSETK